MTSGALDRLEALVSRVDAVLSVPWVSRVASAVVALGAGGVLGAAAWLEPAAEGHGTHLQLGLGRCTFLQLTGRPCPMCGATTTFALLAHFRIVEGVVNQPFAALLFGITLIVFAISIAEAVRPRRRWGRLLARLEPREGAYAALFLVFMGMSWVYKAVMMAP